MQKQSAPKLKILILAMAAGELTQGMALADYALKKGAAVDFVLRLKQNTPLLKRFKKTSNILLAGKPGSLSHHLDAYTPDVFVLCNSKAVGYYKEFEKQGPKSKPITITLDSNWLFLKGENWYSYADWTDMLCVVFPKKVFQMGLKRYGGKYTIPSTTLKKITPVGFIPSTKKPTAQESRRTRKTLGIRKDEKLIFSYFGGYGADHRPWILEHLIASIDKLVAHGRSIRVVYVTSKKNVVPHNLKRPWLTSKSDLSQDMFFSFLATSDLVFQHQGLGTLVQAISARVPVITNVMDLKDEPFPRTAHAWEVEPFVKLNMCNMLYRSSSSEKIGRAVEELLYNKEKIQKMRGAQKLYYTPGEPQTYRIIQRLFSKRKILPTT